MCDMDCVLNNLVEVWVDILNQLYNTSVAVNDIVDYEVYKAFPGLDKEAVENPLSMTSTWNQLKPMHGSAKCLKQIIDYGYNVYISTSTHYSVIKPKVEWLLKHFSFLNYKNVITTHNKSLLMTDYIIDDNYDNLLNSRAKYKICFDQPWNRKYNDFENNIIRVYDWETIVGLLTK